MSQVLFILGGARSGKSRIAQQWARHLSAHPVYLATSRRWDDEHAARIARHRAERGPEWITIEEELSPSRAGGQGRVIVVDCVTLWLANLFDDLDQDLERALTQARSEIDQSLVTNDTWIWVSNELGQGLHAAEASSRRFVDLQGFTNQYLASKSQVAALMVAGLPLPLKGVLPL